MSALIRFPSESPSSPELPVSAEEAKPFHDMHTYLKKRFPLVHKKFQKSLVNGCSLVLHWGIEHAAVAPALFLGHLDVVPAGNKTDNWTIPPYAGEISDGYLYGRGALDIKIQTAALLEALEALVKNGYQPKRDLYLFFGHDEETGGVNGARTFARELREKNINFSFVHDEGGCVIENLIKGLDPPVAVIGVAEKGYADTKLSMAAEGGHSAMPLPRTGLTILAGQITKLAENPCPLVLTPVIRQLFRTLAPRMKGLTRLVMNHPGLFGGLLKKIVAGSKTGNAMLRTTLVPTMSRGSDAPNVIPDHPWVIFNSRLLPGDNLEKLEKHIRTNLVDDRIRIDFERYQPPTKVSPTDTECYLKIKQSIKEVFPEALPAPYLVLGGTDSRHFDDLAEGVYRFSPVRLVQSELDRMHNANERISLENIHRALDFYRSLLLKI